RRSEYVGLLADLAGVSEVSVSQSLQRRLGGKPVEGATTMKRGTARERVERESLRLIVRGDVDGELASVLAATDFSSAKQRVLFDALRGVGWDPGAIIGGEDPDLAARVAALAVEP